MPSVWQGMANVGAIPELHHQSDHYDSDSDIRFRNPSDLDNDDIEIWYHDRQHDHETEAEAINCDEELAAPSIYCAADVHRDAAEQAVPGERDVDILPPSKHSSWKDHPFTKAITKAREAQHQRHLQQPTKPKIIAKHARGTMMRAPALKFHIIDLQKQKRNHANLMHIIQKE